MKVKDYYSILELASSASVPEIKKAYHRLALEHHPDKNNNDSYSLTRFVEIKEAYEVLTNPAKKEYYLQQRWYNQSMGKRKAQDIITPVNILKQVLELEKYVSTLDVFRMDKLGLYNYIMNILADETIPKLNSFNDTTINKQILLALLKCLAFIPAYPDNTIKVRLLMINTDPATTEKINLFFSSHQKIHRREKLKPWLLLVAAAIICLLIFFLSR